MIKVVCVLMLKKLGLFSGSCSFILNSISKIYSIIPPAAPLNLWATLMQLPEYQDYPSYIYLSFLNAIVLEQTGVDLGLLHTPCIIPLPEMHVFLDSIHPCDFHELQKF